MISRILIGASAAIMPFLGGIHLAYTFLTHKFCPLRQAIGNGDEAGCTAYLR